MDKLSLALIQHDTVWHNAAHNMATLEEKIWDIDNEVDVVVLPEMFTTGFSMDVESQAEPLNLHTTKWMKQIAAQTNAAVTGSFICKDKDKYFNRMLWVLPDGKLEWYDKRHLFSMAGEHNFFKAGTERKVVSWRGWNIALYVCYDLRFPVWMRNQNKEYDLSLIVANWPDKRISAWDVLLRGRAVENQCYVAGVNRIGKDQDDILYTGHTSLIDPLGRKQAFSEREEIVIVTCDKKELELTREEQPFLNDGDQFELK